MQDFHLIVYTWFLLGWMVLMWSANMAKKAGVSNELQASDPAIIFTMAIYGIFWPIILAAIYIKANSD